MEAAAVEHDPKLESRFNFLLVSRAARSVGIVYVTLSLPLYLLFLGIRVSIIGTLFLFMVVFSVGLSLLSGMLGDRIGYKYSLLIGDAPMVVATFILFYFHGILPIEIATVVGGIGGAPGGLRGVFAPGLNALVARNWPDSESRVRKMGRLMGVGSAFAFVGALMLYSHGYLVSLFGTAEAFRLLYLISLFLGIVSFVSIILVKERKVKVTRKKGVQGIIDRKSGKYTLRVIGSNLVNGSGIGFSIALLPAWIELRYGVTPSTVGLMFTFSYIATALGSFLAARVIGRTRSPVWTASLSRILQGALIIGLAFSPSLLLVAGIYALRSSIAGFGAPIRTAINVRGISEGNFGFASSAQGMAVRGSQGTSAISGYLMEYSLPIPMAIGGVLQLAGGFVYYRLMKKGNR